MTLDVGRLAAADVTPDPDDSYFLAITMAGLAASLVTATSATCSGVDPCRH